MADILRTARLRPAFIEGARVHLVEMSPRLRDAQRTALTQSAERLAWVDRVEDLPAAPLILVANEFFDALPIHQFLQTSTGWAERMVGLGDDGGLSFGLMPISGSPATEVEAAWGRSTDSTGIVEISPARVAVIRAIAERLSRAGGAALVVDYGYEGPVAGDTLQAVRRHAYADPLAAPGEADLTAHVDFAALAGAAREEGVEPRPLLLQGEFLHRLGLKERASVLSLGKDEATRTAVAAAVERLAGPSGMGELFKVLALPSLGLALPAFDDNSER